jgi:hypothetical protein
MPILLGGLKQSALLCLELLVGQSTLLAELRQTLKVIEER